MLCWQAGRNLVNLVYQLSKNDCFKRDFDLVSQIRRSAVSSMANMIEGFHRSSKKDFIKFLDYARASSQKQSVIAMWLSTRATFLNRN